ncbi:MAG: TraR/DksA family transcriptional regulator [Chlamydiota bacterium]
MEHLRQQLLSLRENIQGEVASLQRDSLSQSPREQSGDLSGYSTHLADTASDSYDREFTISLASREQQVLNDVDTALAKMGTDEYGICEICAHPIDETRLAAVPYARLCLQCKERQEKSRAPA